MDLLISVAAIFAACGLAAFIVRVAGERGRSRIGWGTFSALVAFAGWLAGSLVFTVAIARADATEVSVGAIGSALLAAIVGPLAPMALTLLLLSRLPERVPALGGTRWPMYRLGERDRAAGECEIVFDAGALRIGEDEIPAGAVRELVADGECLRIGWSQRTVTLMPTGAERTPRERAKRSQALERRLRALLSLQ